MNTIFNWLNKEDYFNIRKTSQKFSFTDITTLIQRVINYFGITVICQIIRGPFRAHSYIIMNFQSIKNSESQGSGLDRANKRFYRTAQRNTSVVEKRGISPSPSQQSLSKFYVTSSKLNNLQLLYDECSSKRSDFDQDEDFDFSGLHKARMNEIHQIKDKNSGQNKYKKQQQRLIKFLNQQKQKNQQLRVKLQTVTNLLNEHIKKQEKSMNKMRGSINKQRVKQLEIQNNNLKSQIEQLKDQLKQYKGSKFTEETSNSILQNYQNQNSQLIANFKFQDKLSTNEKEIFNLNDTVRKLQIQMDFLNRRNFSHLQTIRGNYEKQFKSIKDKFAQVLKANNELKKKNTELIYIIKGSKDKKCKKCQQKPSLKRNDSLLSLSSD